MDDDKQYQTALVKSTTRLKTIMTLCFECFLLEQPSMDTVKFESPLASTFSFHFTRQTFYMECNNNANKIKDSI